MSKVVPINLQMCILLLYFEAFFDALLMLVLENNPITINHAIISLLMNENANLHRTKCTSNYMLKTNGHFSIGLCRLIKILIQISIQLY